MAEDPPPRSVATPTKLPLKTGRAMGCAVGVMVMLPMMIAGAPFEGNTVVDGPPVMAPASAEDGVDCCGMRQYS